MERLQKVIANSGYCSRRCAEKLILEGKVNVDGSVLKCWKSGGHGDQTYLQILQNSCNPGALFF